MIDPSSSTAFSQLQYLLQLAYSEEIEDQQRAASHLAKLVEGTVFPVVSFGPLAHALCRLIPSNDRMVASYASRALKLLLLDDALRPQAVVADVPAIVCAAIKQWDDEVICLRELLGALQTLCWDKQCVKGVFQTQVISNLTEYIQANDQEVSVLAISTLANMFQYSDTLLLVDSVNVEALVTAIPPLLEVLKQNPSQKPQKFYSAAALANASAHPRLASVIQQHGGLQVFRDLEKQSSTNLHILGSRLADCAQTAIYRLTDRREGDPNHSQTKYSFKYGTQPTMELTFVALGKNKNAIVICFIIWIFILLATFAPIIFV